LFARCDFQAAGTANYEITLNPGIFYSILDNLGTFQKIVVDVGIVPAGIIGIQHSIMIGQHSGKLVIFKNVASDCGYVMIIICVDLIRMACNSGYNMSSTY
jgi:hypothetical protein